MGFVYKIRSPERVPQPLLDASVDSLAASGGSSSNTPTTEPRVTFNISSPTVATATSLPVVNSEEDKRVSGDSGSSGAFFLKGLSHAYL
jgi:hypothetical protein